MLEEEDLGPADEKLLDLLQEGRVTAPYAAEKADYSLQYTRDRLGRLVEHGNARKVYEGLYELLNDPREPEEETEGRSDTVEAAVEEETSEPEHGTDSVTDALAGWRHGRGEEERAASREIAEQATGWLRDSPLDQVRKSDVPLDELADADPLDRDPDTLWTQVVRDAWQHAKEKGIVEQPHSRAYRWVGE
jgi:hypothetical protein